MYFLTNEAKIVVDPSVSNGYIGIDAIKLIGNIKAKGKAKLNNNLFSLYIIFLLFYISFIYLLPFCDFSFLFIPQSILLFFLLCILCLFGLYQNIF